MYNTVVSSDMTPNRLRCSAGVGVALLRLQPCHHLADTATHALCASYSLVYSLPQAIQVEAWSQKP
jgi:hypothetical protein